MESQEPSLDNISSQMPTPQQHAKAKGKGKVKVEGSIPKAQCRWNPTMVDALVNIMLDIVQTHGKRSDNGHKKDTNTMAADEMMKRGFNVTKDHVTNKLKQMKKEYNAASETLKQSGFSFDHINKVVTANQDVWEKWIQQKPDAKGLRTKWLKHYDDLVIIFGNDYATGGAQYVPGDSEPTYDIGESEMDNDETIVIDEFEVCLDENRSPPTATARPPPKTSQASNGGAQNTPTNKKRKRSRRTEDDPAIQTFQKMVTVAATIAESLARPSMKKLNDALKVIPNMKKEHVRQAYNVIGKDQQLAEIFFGCDEDERKEWVLELLGVAEEGDEM